MKVTLAQAALILNVNEVSLYILSQCALLPEEQDVPLYSKEFGCMVYDLEWLEDRVAQDTEDLLRGRE